MALIGSVAASPATEVFNLDFLPERLLIGATSNGVQSLSNLSVVTSGIQLMSVTTENRITALSKFDQGAILNITAGDDQVASWIRLATGRINKQTTINVTNGAVGSRNVFAASTGLNSIARRAVEQSLNPSANATFDMFEALFFDPTNVLRAQITFANGFTDEYSVAEIDALYASYHVTDAGGKLAVGIACIDANSGAGQISQVVLFNGSGGSTVVLKTDYVQI